MNDKSTIEYTQQYQRERTLARRRDFYMLARYWFGHKCAACGATNVKFEFDHIDPNTKCFNLSSGVNRSIHVWWAELMKCQLLCRKCHIKKSVAARKVVIRHGTLTMYNNYKCRCEECKAASREYARVLRGYSK